MRRLQIYTTADAQAWRASLERAGAYDLYHLPAYHRLAEQRGEGRGQLFVYEAGPDLIALPLLLRPVAAVPGLERIGAGLADATSVYGYPGPVAARPDLPPETIAGFHAALADALGAMGVVALFSRLHPLLDQAPLLAGAGELLPGGPTVSIDLRPDAAAQEAAYRQGHRYEIRRLRRQGLVCERDPTGAHLDAFVAIYHATMRRVGAAPGYFFERDYFERLLAMDGIFQLFVCRQGETVIAAALFSLCQGIAQYHLAGTHDDYLKLAPMKLLVDEARRWAAASGAAALHLGGGLGSREDSLFQFKAGFSDRRHRFAVWRWILDPACYAELGQERAAWAAQRRQRHEPGGFFPAYRGPTAPLAG